MTSVRTSEQAKVIRRLSSDTWRDCTVTGPSGDGALPRPSGAEPRFHTKPMFSFRMISDTRIECRDASSQRETAQIGPTGTDRGGVEPGRAGSVGVDGFLSSLPQPGPYRPSLRDQSPDVLSLAAPL